MFAAIVPHLPYLKDLGVTTIELMPVAQFPGDRNWGYDGVFPYAPQHSYGGPDELKKLVDAAHQEGLSIILDVVYNHFGPEGNVVHRYGPYFTDRYRTPWGDAINFDGPGSDEVRAFFIENALMWLEEYRFDGFRLDAVHQIYDAHAQPFLAELASAVHERAADLGRKVVLIAESDLNDTKLILLGEQGGYGLDAQWADDFCHALETQLVGEESPYLSDFGDFSAMATALEQAFVYTGQYSQMRGRRFGRPPQPARRDQFVAFLQNHDQVGNRPGGARLGHHISFAQRKLGAATVLLSPFVPLIFMGEEYGEPNPFLYITHHGDPDLIEGVRAGRLEEFSHWNWDTDDAAPDPQDVATLERSRLQLALHAADHDDAAEHRALYDFYREALALRRALPALTDPESTRSVTAHEAERVIVVHTIGRNDSDELLTVLAFGDEPVTAPLPVSEGTWQKRLDAGDARFLGEAATPETLGAGDLSNLPVPPHAALLFERTA
jgi:maltooligosyltrehalose trehalohydrolase